MLVVLLDEVKVVDAVLLLVLVDNEMLVSVEVVEAALALVAVDVDEDVVVLIVLLNELKFEVV